MCGRYAAAFSVDELREIFSIPLDSVEHSPRYNVAPTQPGLIVATHEGKPSLSIKPFGIKARDTLHINARAETLLEKSTFRQLERCLIPATGFYEWRQKGKERIPHYFTVPDKHIFAFAGLYDNRGFVIITTEPSRDVAPIHNRMPVILSAFGDYTYYLRESATDAFSLLQPFNGRLSRLEVTKYVNHASHDDEQCIVPANRLW